MKTPTRVTKRCLHDDLTDDWDDTADQRLVQACEEGITKAVHLLQHKLIQKAVDDFPIESDHEKKRESITGLTNPPFWKVKTERWRGAIYVNPDGGQAWLVAAGRRYGGEAKDFYKQFMADVESKGAEFFLPSEADLTLRKKELSLNRLEVREERIKSQAVDLLARALKSEGHYAQMDLVHDSTAEESHTIGHVELLVELPSSDEPLLPSLLIEVSKIDWSYFKIFAWDEQIMLSALCPEEDRWGTTHTDVRIHSLEVPSYAELQAMARGEVAKNPLGYFTPGKFTHTVHRARLTESTIEGEPVQGVCGRWFVPRQDHEGKPQCETCLTFVQTLEMRVESTKGP